MIKGVSNTVSLCGGSSGPITNTGAILSVGSSLSKDKKKEKKDKKEAKTKLKLKKSKAPESDSDNGKGKSIKKILFERSIQKFAVDIW